mmetsp:Transcript_41295/g.134402  ORF Transcript_41295/g.134402 Transcript_41295/m.134402 type:complete len:312 (-) Transcript_41295:133-1068(-)
MVHVEPALVAAVPVRDDKRVVVVERRRERLGGVEVRGERGDEPAEQQVHQRLQPNLVDDEPAAVHGVWPPARQRSRLVCVHLGQQKLAEARLEEVKRDDAVGERLRPGRAKQRLAAGRRRVRVAGDQRPQRRHEPLRAQHRRRRDEVGAAGHPAVLVHDPQLARRLRLGREPALAIRLVERQRPSQRFYRPLSNLPQGWAVAQPIPKGAAAKVGVVDAVHVGRRRGSEPHRQGRANDAAVREDKRGLVADTGTADQQRPVPEAVAGWTASTQGEQHQPGRDGAAANHAVGRISRNAAGLRCRLEREGMRVR